MGKRLAVPALALILALGLAGCSAALEKRAMKASGVAEDPDYLAYQEALEAGEIVESGQYAGYTAEAARILAQERDGGGTSLAEVSLASSNMLDVKLYLDSKFTDALDAGVGLSAGTPVYGKVSVRESARSDRYAFDHFRIVAYDGAGTEISREDPAFGADGLVFIVPQGAARVSVLPIGRYEPRVLSLTAEYLSGNGEASPFEGVWLVNSVETVSGSVQIPSASEYTVEFDYRSSADSYYVDRTRSSPQIARDEAGIASFAVQSPKGGAESFHAVLRSYIEATVDNEKYSIFNRDIVSSALVNGEEVSGVRSKSIVLGNRLKTGDRIVLRVKGGYEVYAPELTVSAPVDTDNGKTHEYTVTVPDTFFGTAASLTVREETSEVTRINASNVSVNLTYDGNNLSVGDRLPDRAKVTVTVRPAEGYYLTGKGVKDGAFVKEMDFKEYREEIDSIIAAHPSKKYINVTLPETDAQGTYTFTFDGETVTGFRQFKENDKLKWVYTVTDSGYQVDKMWPWGKDKDNGTLTVTADLDGKTLTRGFLGVDLEKKK